jgi:hypothetical protein
VFATRPGRTLADDWSIETEQRQRHDGTPYTAYSLVRPDGTTAF